MRVLAMYLPQFHRIKENDEWWREGYTEWTAVKEAKPLFKHHTQPRIPLDENYYNLLERKTMKYQAELMNNYGIDGMCFYHYYFEDGKKVLEKPAENLLKWTDIRMPFCFCWANESWVRTWSNVNSGAVWSTVYEKKSDNEKENGILLEQKYGNEQQWEEHFYYLLPFFKDSRYIKKDGCPVFIFFKPDSIYCLKEMKEYWNELAQKEGIKSIYFIETRTSDTKKKYEHEMIYEPAYTESVCFIEGEKNNYGLRKWISYDSFWRQLLLKTDRMEKGICLGGVVGYDNTPRHGYNGMILYGGTPEKFQNYLSALFVKAVQLESEFIFLNAWNEWAEGMYLEPDMEWKYAYLEAVVRAKSFCSDYMKCKNILEKDIKSEREYAEKKATEKLSRLEEENVRFRSFWMTLNRWLELNLQGKSLGRYIKSLKYEKIAIYGLGMLGERLLTELANYGIEIVYGIDQRGERLRRGFPEYRLQDKLPEVDLIIVTVNYDYETIREQLRHKVKSKIISLDALLFEI